jgi:hypothetical protein
MSDYNNDVDMDDIENDFLDPLPTDSHEQIGVIKHSTKSRSYPHRMALQCIKWTQF